MLLGDLPNPYVYIVDGDGEAIQAKRRGAAVLVSHLTPMIVAGGALPDFTTLDDALENLERTAGVSVDLANQYRETALSEIRRLKLDAQLRIPLDVTPWDEVQERVHRFLHDTETNTLPLGLHTMGEAPPEANQREGLAAFMAFGFDESEAPLVKADVTGWADAVYDGKEPVIRDGFTAPLREKITRTIADGRTWIANVRESPASELDALVTVLNGRHLPSASFGDPLRVPSSLPTGRNEHASDTQLIPTKAAWAVGQKMARDFVVTYRKQHGGTYPDKVSQVLWSGETLRHQGALESMALSLLGVEPIWNARGVVDDLKLIPDAALGRPRVDVLFTISGIYRDSLPEKVLLLDKAVRLAASAGDNAISRHDRQVASALQKSGTSADMANQIARARVFGEKPGAYGVGVAQVVERSRDARDPNAVGDVFMHNSNFAFSSEMWGGTTGGALAAHLAGNQAVLFSRTSTLYGAVDNDDVYQYFGGLGAATKQVNGGAAPDMFINNLRKDGASSMSSLQEWLASELNTRSWNEKWLKEMQRSGYGGAREMAKGLEYLYGFQATAKEQMDGTFWQNSFDVLVNDKHHLGLDQFFADVNPHAQQSILARLIEVDRQGSYRFSESDRATLVQKYVESVARNGVSCTANTCGNIEVNQYIGEQAALISGLGQETMRRF
ncbi:MAG: cobaltochelatase subunit CobN, partial [Vicinamibacterales bacterium]